MDKYHTAGERCPTEYNTLLLCSLSLRAILKELGLQGKVSTYQMAKKWDNLKRRYKVSCSSHSNLHTFKYTNIYFDFLEGVLMNPPPFSSTPPLLRI